MDTKYEICRSVSKTIQEKQFEPKSHFSSHKMGFSEVPSDELIDATSKLLLARAESDITRSINTIKKPLTPEEEYVATPPKPVETYQWSPKDPWRKNPKPTYISTFQGPNGQATKVELTNAMKQANTIKPY